MTDLLKGITVLDMARYYPGSHCTKLLAGLGATVIKIEAQGEFDNLSVVFAGLNPNKKSIVLNLKSAEGRKILQNLISRADVFIENFKPGVIETLGFDYPRVQKLNPAIVYCSIATFGQTGPYRYWPLHDQSITAISGLLSLNKEKATDYFPVAITGVLTGTYAAFAITAALYKRKISGLGCNVDVSMLDSLITSLALHLAQPELLSSEQSIVIDKNIYETSDGGQLAVLITTPSEWDRLCDALQQPGLKQYITDKQKRQKISSTLSEIFRTKTRDEWSEIMLANGVSCAPVKSINELVNDPQVASREMIKELEHQILGKLLLTGEPAKFSIGNEVPMTSPPVMGQHTEEILRELGYSSSEIMELEAQGVISLG